MKNNSIYLKIKGKKVVKKKMVLHRTQESKSKKNVNLYLNNIIGIFKRVINYYEGAHIIIYYLF